MDLFGDFMTFEVSPHGYLNKIGRIVWGVCYIFLFRPSPRFMHGWRRFLLRIFGAKLHHTAIVYQSVKIWAPWNLTMKPHSCLSHGVDVYNQGVVTIGFRAVVSQRAFLCTATHDYRFRSMPLVINNINIGDNSWICAEAFIGPGVVIGSECVVGVRSVVLKSTDNGKLYAGIPAKLIGDRFFLDN